jgi:hypothetical protein
MPLIGLLNLYHSAEVGGSRNAASGPAGSRLERCCGHPQDGPEALALLHQIIRRPTFLIGRFDNRHDPHLRFVAALACLIQL